MAGEGGGGLAGVAGPVGQIVRIIAGGGLQQSFRQTHQHNAQTIREGERAAAAAGGTPTYYYFEQHRAPGQRGYTRVPIGVEDIRTSHQWVYFGGLVDPTTGKWISPEFGGRATPPPPPPPPRPGPGAVAAAASAVARYLPRGRGGVFQAAPSSTTTGGQSTSDWLADLDARLQRALALRDWLTWIMSLFRRDQYTAGGSLTINYPTEVQQVPYLLAPTGSLPAGSFGMDFAGGLSTVARGVITAAQIYNQLKSGGNVMPGGMMFGGPEFGGVSSGSSTVSMGPGWRNGRAVRYSQVNPYNGQCVSFRPDGRCLLFSGDVQAMKRVKRAARLARRAVGGR